MLIIVRGIPGSGKSTFANRHWKHVVEADDFFTINGSYYFNSAYLNQAHDYCWNRTLLLVHAGLDVCVSNTFVLANQITRYKLLAEALKIEFKVYKMTNEYQSIHSVPDNTVNRMKSTGEAWPGEIMVNENHEWQNTTNHNQGFDH